MRILFLTHTNIGDAVLSTILLNKMMAEHPNAVVDIACGAKSVDLFRGFPNLGELHPVIKRKNHGHHIDLWRKFKGNSYDYVVDLRGTALAYFLKKKKVIRFSSKDKKNHKSVQLASLFQSDFPIKQTVWPAQQHVEKVENSIQTHEGCMLIGLGPTSNWLPKTWPQRKFAILVNKILNTPNIGDVKFVLFGAAHERKSVEDLVDYIPEEMRVDLIGKTSLGEACAWMQKLDLFIGHDSGLSHLAAACDIETITLFGPTCEKVYAPVNTKGRLVIAKDTADVNLIHHTVKRLITDITVKMVYDEFLDVMNTKIEQNETQNKEMISA